MAESPDPRLRYLPSVERVLQRLEAEGHLDGVPRVLAARYVRQVVEGARRRLLDGTASPEWSPEVVVRESAQAVAWYGRPRLGRAVNATGILIHTNLGRAPLSPAAQEAVRAAAGGYTLLEIDPDSGDRGSRQAHVEGLLEVTTGAEAGFVVNNNAAAVLLGLAAVAAGREVIVSRGELVEIGGAFRMPDVMAQSGARLVEIGTTNKTYLHDYERAVTPQTALLLKVHRSNFTMTGFVHDVDLRDLVALGAARGLTIMYDLGSGALVDLRTRGLPPEPTVGEAVSSGAALVTFSGDKLLGGPQAGIMVGRAETIDRCRRHPLARAVRIDRLDLAALAATLRHYLRREEAWVEVPVLRMLAAGRQELAERATWLAERLRAVLGDQTAVTAVSADAQVGGGALPAAVLPSAAVLVHPGEGTPETWAARLRRRDPPVIVRIQEGGLLLNLRTILPEDLDAVVAAFTPPPQ